MTTTVNFGYELPDINASTDTWGTELNLIFTKIDSDLAGVRTTAENALADATAFGDSLVTVATATADAQTTADQAVADAAAADTKAQSALDIIGGGPLGTASAEDIGTSGATVPLLNGVNTFSSLQTFSEGSFTNTLTYRGGQVARVASGTDENSGLISFGTGAPGALAEGQIYLRHA